MAEILGQMKLAFLNRINERKDITIKDIHKWLSTFEDLKIEDFKGYVSDELYEEFCKYLERENEDWENVNKGSYTALKDYLAKYPYSVHFEELDDLMWKNTHTILGSMMLNRYLDDWPLGRHAKEAHQVLSEFPEWDEVRNSKDIFKVYEYKATYPDSPFKNEINSIYFSLRDNELEKMKNPNYFFDKDDVESFFNAGIFTKEELIIEGLMTEESWMRCQLESKLFDCNLLTSDTEYQIINPDLTVPDDCTDIYFFGSEGSGKTCMHMGFLGVDGRGFALDKRKGNGNYAETLQKYVNMGFKPSRTFSYFIPTIHGLIYDEVKGRSVTYPVNLIEMSGIRFIDQFIKKKDVSFADMGEGAINVLRNDNRKVFFILVNPITNKSYLQYIEQVRDDDGNIINDIIRKRYFSQLDFLNNLISLFYLPESEEIMRKVDAIHFIVTKADLLSGFPYSKGMAQDLFNEKYRGPMQNLKNYCLNNRRINAATMHTPQVYTFSLGKFYLGGVFDYDRSDTFNLIEVINGEIRHSKRNKLMKLLKNTR